MMCFFLLINRLNDKIIFGFGCDRMIEIKNLTKIYKSKNTPKCIALNDLSFTLPDKGMVFVIGKSGSGKSTLLNMLGGLDNITSGEIVADGNKLSSFTPSDFNKYRSTYIGFIFQDYHLLDDLTIAQNIKLALDISNVKGKKIISETLKKVDLEGYEKRYPRELSGGQKQRVAIARALAKNPKLILGDEPTGNLDNKTSTQVLDLLKEVSKERLVVIVSHNLADADKYADRIIELHEGKILSDKERIDNYNNDFKIVDSTVYLPHYRDLSMLESKEFASAINNGVCEIIQNDNGFVAYEKKNYSSEKVELSASKISNKSLAKLSKSFFSRRKNNKSITIIFTTFIFMLIAMLQSFYMFNPNVNKNDNNTDIILNKGSYTAFEQTLFSAPLYPVLDEEIDKFYDAGYEGNVYKLYNTSLLVLASNHKINYGMNHDYQRNFEQFYICETYGTLNCSEDYLVSKYGIDGKLNVLSGDLYNSKYGTIITDYVADSIIYYRPESYKSYADIIGTFPKNSKNTYGYISAIIDTNYEEKYKSIISKYKSIQKEEYEELYLELCEDKLFEEFIKEAYSYLGIGYNFNPNYAQDIQSSDFNSNLLLRHPTIISNSKEYSTSDSGYIQFIGYEGSSFSKKENLEAGEIAFHVSTYNKLFGTSYNSYNLDSFIPHKIRIEMYINEDPKLGLYLSEEFYIKCLVSSTSIINDEDFKLLSKGNYYAYGLYFDNSEYSDLVISIGNDNSFYIKHINFDNIVFINKLVSIFKPFFLLILLLLFVALLVYLVSFGINNIKKNLYEIGIIKSLGGRTRDIGKIFISHVLLTGFLICVLSVIAAPTIIIIANNILIDSFQKVMSLYLFDYSIINILPIWIAVDLFMVVVITFISAFLPMVFLYKIKPLEIIRAKE